MRVLIIGLDGATWDLLKPWAEEGKLPTLKKLMDNGAYGVLRSTIPCRTCPAIPALYTGKNPGKLGIFDLVKADGSLVTYNDIKEPSIWDILGWHGYKSAVIGLRTTYPPRKLNGIMISGRCPSEECPYTYPRELKKKVKGFHSYFREFNQSKEKFIKDTLNFAIGDMWTKYRLSRQFLYGNFDFAIFWLGAPDFAQHYLWHQKPQLLQFFQEVEKMLGEILKDFSGNLFIVSDHGFGPAATENFYINTWLKREGYLKLKRGKIIQWLLGEITILLSRLPERGRRLVLNVYKDFLRVSKKTTEVGDEEKEHGLSKPAVIYSPLVDVKDTIAYSDRYWGVWVFDKADLEKNHEEMKQEIIAKLINLRNNEGEQIITDVKKREEIFSGKYIDKIPDIVFLAKEGIAPTDVLSNSLFRKRRNDYLTGSHDTARSGIFLAYGPDIKKRVELGEADITDILPTVLHLYNLPISADIEGRVLKAIFREDSVVFKRPVRYQGRMEEERIKGKIRELRVSGKI